MVKKKTEEKDQRTRYSDVDLQEFKELILNKLKLATDEFHKMQKSLLQIALILPDNLWLFWFFNKHTEDMLNQQV